MSPLAPRSEALTDIGLYRQRNEDRLLARDDLALWAVCDGLGGLADGDRAAQAVVDMLADMPATTTVAEAISAFDTAISRVNMAIFRAAAAAGTQSGTTLAAMVWREGMALLVWCGDSRIYRLRDGRLTLLTRDHNVENDLLDAGATKAEAASHPEGHYISRCLGTEPDAQAEFTTEDVAAGDLFLLCTDGLHGEIKEAEILAALQQTARPAPLALKRATYRAGAWDNLTFVLVRF